MDRASTEHRQEPAVQLEPDRYVCPIHQVDLTELVRQQLSDVAAVDVAFGGPSWTRLLHRAEPTEPRPFQVEVFCPAAGAGHGQVCEGTYRP
jgi:hypothetical protein